MFCLLLVFVSEVLGFTFYHKNFYHSSFIQLFERSFNLCKKGSPKRDSPRDKTEEADKKSGVSLLANRIV